MQSDETNGKFAKRPSRDRRLTSNLAVAARELQEENKIFEKERYVRFVEERGGLAKAGLEVSGRFDTWCISIPAGALALSLAFLEKIAPQPVVSTKLFLVVAWGALIAGLLSGFASLLTAQNSLDDQIKILDLEYTTRQSRRNRFNVWTSILNWTSCGSSILGVIFLCFFAYANLPTQIRKPSQASFAVPTATGTTNSPPAP